MDTKDIQAFVKCFDERSINKAAKKLFVTPQGLGKILDRIESELPLPLFERTSKGLFPTESGIFLRENAPRLLEAMHEIECGLEAIKNKNRILKIGCACGVLRILGVKKLEDFQRTHGDFSVSFEESDNRDIKEKLRGRLIDASLTVGKTGFPDIEETEIFRAKMCAVIRRDNPLGLKKQLFVRDLKNLPLITLNEKYQCYSSLLQCCRDSGFAPNIRVKTMESSFIYQAVRDGFGVGIDADIHSGELPSSVMTAEIEDFPPWTIFLSYKKDRAQNESVRALSAFFSSK